VIVGYAIPGFLFAILLIVLFAGGSFFQIFPCAASPRELLGPALVRQIGDYLWHITLPITAMALGAFATSTLLTKNSFLDEIRKQYVLTARMKGLSERQVLYGHVFRNAMLIVIAGFPAPSSAPSSAARCSSRRSSPSTASGSSPSSRSSTATTRGVRNLYIFSLLGCGEPPLRPHLHLESTQRTGFRDPMREGV
jgi:microcin C transport system permease protein